MQRINASVLRVPRRQLGKTVTTFSLCISRCMRLGHRQHPHAEDLGFAASCMR